MADDHMSLLIDELLTKQGDLYREGGEARIRRMHLSQSELLMWISHFEASTGCARPLLSGSRAALAEALSYVGVGLGRAAIASIRTQIDLILSYTYFSDHPREWDLLIETDTGYMLRGDILTYHTKLFPNFSQRLALVEAKGTLGEIYKLLSAHVHAQSSFTAPTAVLPVDLVATTTFLDSVIELQEASVLRLSNYLTALYAAQWQDLPKQVVQRVQALIKPKNKAIFFSSSSVGGM